MELKDESALHVVEGPAPHSEERREKISHSPLTPPHSTTYDDPRKCSLSLFSSAANSQSSTPRHITPLSALECVHPRGQRVGQSTPVHQAGRHAAHVNGRQVMIRIGGGSQWATCRGRRSSLSSRSRSAPGPGVLTSRRSTCRSVKGRGGDGREDGRSDRLLRHGAGHRVLQGIGHITCGASNHSLS